MEQESVMICFIIGFTQRKVNVSRLTGEESGRNLAKPVKLLYNISKYLMEGQLYGIESACCG